MRIFIVDAFTNRAFAGNPAAVCLLDGERPDDWMQSIAAEMNLSETAFLLPKDNGEFHLRWFTPKLEVDLCGHATLASAHVLWSVGLVVSESSIRFDTRSGTLIAVRREDQIELDFPSVPAEQVEVSSDLVEAIGDTPQFVGQSRLDTLIVLVSETSLRKLRPNFPQLAKIDARGFIVTARSDNPEFDFVSRYFAPAAGIDEDPVTGSAHCCLGPYWAEQLGKSELTGFQASERGGVVRVRMAGNRAFLAGHAVTILRGALAESAFE